MNILGECFVIGLGTLLSEENSPNPNVFCKLFVKESHLKTQNYIFRKLMI